VNRACDVQSGRVVDLLDPHLTQIGNMDVEGGAAPRPAWRSGGRPRHRRIVLRSSPSMARLSGWRDRCKFSADALLSREAPRRPALFVADRIDTIHRALAAEGWPISFTRATRAWCPRTTSWILALVAVPIPRDHRNLTHAR